MKLPNLILNLPLSTVRGYVQSTAVSVYTQVSTRISAAASSAKQNLSDFFARSSLTIFSLPGRVTSLFKPISFPTFSFFGQKSTPVDQIPPVCSSIPKSKIDEAASLLQAIFKDIPDEILKNPEKYPELKDSEMTRSIEQFNTQFKKKRD